MRFLLSIALIGLGSACAANPTSQDDQSSEATRPETKMADAKPPAKHGKLYGKAGQGRKCSAEPAAGGGKIREDCVVPLAKMPVASQPTKGSGTDRDPPKR